MKDMEECNTGKEAPVSSPSPFIPHPVTPILRTAMCLDGENLYVVLCGSLPTLMAHLICRKNVRLYIVRSSTKLKEMLMDENGIPADLAIVEAHRLADLPQMSFFSPTNDHECTVIFSPDPFVADKERLDEIYALIDGLLAQKQQQVEMVAELMREEAGNVEGGMKGFLREFEKRFLRGSKTACRKTGGRYEED